VSRLTVRVTGSSEKRSESASGPLFPTASSTVAKTIREPSFDAVSEEASDKGVDRRTRSFPVRGSHWTMAPGASCLLL